MTDLTELNKLEQYFKDRGIEYERIDKDDPFLERHQIKWKMPQKNSKRKLLNDVICQRNSYGHEQGLLEGMGSLFVADVEGYLTADDVIKRIEQ